MTLPSGASFQLEQQFLQRGDLRGLDQVVLEAGLADPAAGFLLTPAGERNERRPAPLGRARSCRATS